MRRTPHCASFVLPPQTSCWSEKERVQTFMLRALVIVRLLDWILTSMQRILSQFFIARSCKIRLLDNLNLFEEKNLEHHIIYKIIWTFLWLAPPNFTWGIVFVTTTASKQALLILKIQRLSTRLLANPNSKPLQRWSWKDPMCENSVDFCCSCLTQVWI